MRKTKARRYVLELGSSQVMESCSGNDTQTQKFLDIISLLSKSLSNSSVNGNTLKIFCCKLLACNVLIFPESSKLQSAIK